ncbi:hypothetical protein DL89DRAFT_272949, partial [Linderina pennispora]
MDDGQMKEDCGSQGTSSSLLRVSGKVLHANIGIQGPPRPTRPEPHSHLAWFI